MRISAPPIGTTVAERQPRAEEKDRLQPIEPRWPVSCSTTVGNRMSFSWFVSRWVVSASRCADRPHRDGAVFRKTPMTIASME